MANTYNQEHLVFLNLQVKSSSFVPMRSQSQRCEN